MEPYFIIVGLGNPGRKYDGSRHNVGFDVIDELVDRFHVGGPDRFGKSMIGKGRIGDRKVILVKPLTYMNLSGETVQEIVHYYKADPALDLVVISDDIDLEAGRLRLRKKGSAGGHNGLKNIVQHLGTTDFPRIRVGVGAKPDPDYDLADYVLGHFSAQEKKIMEEAVSKAADAVACIVTDGVDLAMNRYNTPRKKKEKRPRRDPAAQEDAQGTGEKTPAAQGSAPAAESEAFL
ncbi:MAG: aminoacyl-tRNA hydrolase [Sarcina sp.]|nr:aminoacyl-tRNA hydrolase [Sarcina sp.]